MDTAAMVSIRPAVAADAEALHALAQRAYGRYVERVGARPAPMDTDYAAAIATDEVWVAAEDDQPVGLLVLKILNDHLLLENIAVSPDWQGRGIGAELLALAEGRACAAGVTEVRLYTHETMTENLQLYARHGYRETRRAKEDGFRRVFLTKPLPPPPWQKDPAAE